MRGLEPLDWLAIGLLAFLLGGTALRVIKAL